MATGDRFGPPAPLNVGMELENQIALVTGGTAGIGLATARLLASEGAEVVIAGRDAERGANAVSEVGGKTRFVRTDLGDLDSVAELVSQAGEVDILVNNAGAFPVAPTVEQDMTSLDAMFDTNVRAPTSWWPRWPRG